MTVAKVTIFIEQHYGLLTLLQQFKTNQEI